MKKIVIGAALVMGVLLNAHAQFNSPLDRKIKYKVKSRIDNNVDQLIDKGLDETEKAVKTSAAKDAKKEPEQEASKPVAQTTTAQTQAAPQNRIKAQSRFDFVAGDKVLYAEDFAQDAVGELPQSWNANGKGEVVTLDGFEGKWLRMFTGMQYLSGNEKSFGENFTIEFDLILEGTPPSGTRFFPEIKFGMFSSGTASTTDNAYIVPNFNADNITTLLLKPHEDDLSRMKLESRIKNNALVFKSEDQLVADYSKSFRQVAHYAIQVQKQRMRFWVNETKVFDVPRAMTVSPSLNQMFFNIEDYTFYNDSNFGLYVSNFKIATGLPDTRHKLVDEGKFSTTGILFETNSDVIKSNSYGSLKEIANILNEHADLNIKVIGHTDSDGDAKSNLDLSIKRAAAVKKALSEEFNIDASRMETSGAGESEPVADNKTKEAKAANRRVEFIKV